MERIKKHKHIIILLSVIVAIICYKFIADSMKTPDVPYREHYDNAVSQTSQMNAKTIFTFTSTSISELSVKYDVSSLSGVYYGSLNADEGGLTGMSGEYSAELHNSICNSCANMGGYYFVTVKNGLPTQAFWCADKIMLENVSELTEFANRLPEKDAKINNFIYNSRISGYPEGATEIMDTE